MASIGLGYVGLPVAVAFARQGYQVVGYDLDSDRVASLKRGMDPTGEVSAEALERSRRHVPRAAPSLVPSPRRGPASR